MANYRNDFADVNLETGTICRNFMNHSIGSGDALGDRFGVRVFRNGEPVSLGGTVAGYFVRNTTGETVVISSGVVSGNEAYVTLPAACYAVEGSFTLAIKVTSGSETVTMRIIDGVVSRTNTSVTVDPGTLVPSIETLISAINSAVGQIPVNYNASFAPAYSASSTYAVGDYVVYDGYLWRCTTAITETESWTAAHWTKVALASDVSDLKSALKDNIFIADDAIANIGKKILKSFRIQLNVEIGTFDTSGYADAANRARSQILPAGSYNVTVTSNYQFAIVKYISDSSGVVYVSGRTNQSFTLDVPFVIQLRHVSSGETFKNAELSKINEEITVTAYKDTVEYINETFEDGNLFDIHLCKLGYGIDSNGAEAVGNNNALTDYIYVGNVGTVYTNNKNKTIAYYTESKTYIDQVTSNATSYTLPNNCTYIRVAIALPNSVGFILSTKSQRGTHFGIKPRNGLTGAYVAPDIASSLFKNNIDSVEKMDLSTVAFNGHAGRKSYDYTLGEEYSLYAINTASGAMDIRITGNTINAVGVAGLKIYVYIPDKTKVTTIACALTGTSNTRSFTSFVNGWNIFTYRPHQGSLATWETIQGMRITTAGSAGIELYIAKIEIIRPAKATMILVNDGGYSTFIDYAYDTLKGYGIPVTWALNPGRMGADLGNRGRLMTEEEAIAMSADYCSEFSFHCWSATVKPTQYMTAIELQNDCQKCVDYLRKKGLAPEHIWRAAHAQNNAPYYQSEIGIVEALATGTENGASLCVFPFEDRWNVPRFSIHARTNADFDTIFDTLKKTHCGIIPYTHGVSTIDDHDISPSSMDYFISKVVTGMTEGWLDATTYNYWVNAQLK